MSCNFARTVISTYRLSERYFAHSLYSVGLLIGLRFMKGSILTKISKILGWTFLAMVIVLGALLFCVVKFVDSRQLSTLIERVANDYIDGHLKVGNVELGFQPRFPILRIEVQDLSITSHAFDSLNNDERGLLPIYADSLISLEHMTGSLDVKRLLVNNELSLHDVVLRGLSINLVIARNGKANYELIKMPADTLKSPDKKMPGFRINRFALEQPKEIRFYNAADSTSASVLLLTDAAVDGDKMPTYRLTINGDITSPKATLITNLDHIGFGMNGNVYWNPSHPGLVAMDEFELQGAFIKALVTGEIDFGVTPVVRKAKVNVAPVAFTDLLSMLPDSIREVHLLYEPYFSTDATVEGCFELNEPMDLATDSLPDAVIKVSIPPSTLHYGNSRFEELSLDAVVNTVTNCPDSTTINITRCIIAGVSTRLELSALLSEIFSDPSFSTDLQGEIDLKNLPPIIGERIPGYISGIVSTDLHAHGKMSMLKRNHFHKLITDGAVTAHDIYYLSADTNKMVQLNKATIDFNAGRIGNDIPELKANLDIDTANILVNGVDIAFSTLTLGAQTQVNGNNPDSALIVPVGGKLKVNRLNIISITDSAGARIRNLTGNVIFRGDKLPDISAELNTGTVSAGSLADHILLFDTSIKASLQKLPSTIGHPAERRPLNGKFREYRRISPDSVFKIVYARRHHKPGEKRTRRVYGTLTDDDTEVLEWNLARGFSKFLTGWELKGSLSTHRARLHTPVFPLHNRFSRLDIRFNNDTVDITDISLKAGKSDITLSGLVTNVRQALTSKSHDTLKINLSLLSDTIDINEMSAGIFTGSSYSGQRHSSEKRRDTSSDPILIPVNVDANIRIAADNVLYSNLVMGNMSGDILVYDGAINLHNIQAYSDAGSLTCSALYSSPGRENRHFGFGMELKDFNIGKFVTLVPVIDSIMPLIHDFSGTIGADIAATCRLDSGMNIMLPTLDAAIRISGDNLAFINPHTYHTLGKWLGFKDKTNNTIRQMNVEMTVDNGLLHVYPFAFNIDRYRLGVYGSNDMAMNFDYHLSVLKSPLPFKFGINISGSPKKYKVRFGGAKFNENTSVESVSIVNDARINLIEQIENVFRRGVRNSRFAKLQIARPADFETIPDQGLSAADSLQLIREGLIDAPVMPKDSIPENKPEKKRKKFLFF